MTHELKVIGFVMLGSIIVLLLSFFKKNFTLQLFSLGYLLGLITYEIIILLLINK